MLHAGVCGWLTGGWPLFHFPTPPDVWLQLLERCAAEPGCHPTILRHLAQQQAEQRALAAQQLLAQQQLVSAQNLQMSDLQQQLSAQQEVGAE
jgi:hypothetical protein